MLKVIRRDFGRGYRYHVCIVNHPDDDYGYLHPWCGWEDKEEVAEQELNAVMVATEGR